jgi:hypothetical protein
VKNLFMAQEMRLFGFALFTKREGCSRAVSSYTETFASFLQTTLRIDPNSAQTRNLLNAILSGPKYSPQDALRQKQRTEHR